MAEKDSQARDTRIALIVTQGLSAVNQESDEDHARHMTEIRQKLAETEANLKQETTRARRLKLAILSSTDPSGKLKKDLEKVTARIDVLLGSSVALHNALKDENERVGIEQKQFSTDLMENSKRLHGVYTGEREEDGRAGSFIAAIDAWTLFDSWVGLIQLWIKLFPW
jgi:septal ring factor EnvC (AmiA/AmiB activator)